MAHHVCDTDSDVHLSVRVPQSMKDELSRRAAGDDRSISSYVKRVLADHLATEQVA